MSGTEQRVVAKAIFSGLSLLPTIDVFTEIRDTDLNITTFAVSTSALDYGYSLFIFIGLKILAVMLKLIHTY